MLHLKYIFFAVTLPFLAAGFQLGDTKSTSKATAVTRRAALGIVGGAALAVLVADPQPSNAIPEQKFYSSNARNMARLNSGDQSGGSVYDNNPSSPGAAKRRALQGCKISSTRNLAAEEAGIRNLTERDCNLRVLGGDSEFMLKAMRALSCPTCPFGIDAT
mmetsp:Transcript_33822/g.99670  ORF Transcript_33822/g.99670 Transcript_33822/m.99670 type:complete len:161 (-) Transcript_33822:3834-4316(-)